MSTETTTTDDSWRGVANEEAQVTTSGNLVLAKRSRRLLWSLVRPYRARAATAIRDSPVL